MDIPVAPTKTSDGKEITPRNRPAPDLKLGKGQKEAAVFDLGDLYRFEGLANALTSSSLLATLWITLDRPKMICARLWARKFYYVTDMLLFFYGVRATDVPSALQSE